jgi:glutamate N-acetyltransferase/amino-acid N-acetyltransferase
VIGQPLPSSKSRKGVARLITRLRPTGGADAADAILTTDTRAKQVALQARIAGRRVTVGGMAKGSGMIHPDMATMLAYLTTDVAISQRVLQKALRAAVEQSFHCISVDGETSTNDTVLCLANGMAGNLTLREGVPGLATFQRLLNQACTSLALQVCRDGEGVTKVVEVVVRGARTAADAKQVARTIGTSNLVKTAWFGEDANWGRILAAIGRSGVPVDHNRISLAFEDRPVVRRGMAIGPQAERRVSKILRRKEFSVTADLGLGRGTARLWTNDLSYEYVEINASYRS